MAKIRKGRKIILLIFLSIIFSLCLAFGIQRVSVLKLGASVSNGWSPEGNFWYYYENGTKKTGWFEYGNPSSRYWYYLSTTEKEINGVTYPQGAMVTGWYKDDDGYWYYLSPSNQTIYNVNYKEGAMVTGWLDYNNGSYYLRKEKNDVVTGPHGAMITGDNQNPTECYEINRPGMIYCFDKNGKVYDDTLVEPRYEVTPSTICRVPIDKSHENFDNNSYKLSGVYFYDHYAVYAAIRELKEGDVKHEYTYLTLVDLNNNCNILSKVYAGEIGHSNDITYNSSTNKFYIAENSSIYEFQIINNQITNVQKTLDLTNSYITSIAYDDTNNKFFSYHSSNLYKFDSLNTYVENSSTHFNRAPQYYKNFIYRYNNKIYNPWFITQGIDYSNNNLYQVGTISDGNDQINYNSSEHNSTFVLVYDGNSGSYKYNMHFNKTYGNIHAESLTVDNEDMYIGAIEYDSNSNEINNIFYKVTDVATIDNDYNTSIKSIEVIKTLPWLVFYKGAPFNYTNIILRITYNDDSKDYAELNSTNATISNFDKDTIGIQTITVTYNNQNYNLDIEVVDKIKVDKPTMTDGSKVYNGTEQSPIFDGLDSNSMNIKNGANTDAGNYTAIISLNNKDKYEWSDGTQDDLEFNWSISKAKLTKPTMTESSFEYDCTAKSPQFTGFDSNTMNITGNDQIVSGNYTAIISIKDKNNYDWSDDTQTDLEFNWEILKAKLPKPTIDGTNTFTFDGIEKGLSFENLNTDIMTVTGNSNIAAGTYITTIGLSDTNNYTWDDDSTSGLIYNWSITKAQLTKPSIIEPEEPFVYDGEYKTISLANYDSNTMKTTGTTSENKAGIHNLTVSIFDKNNYEWDDDTQNDVELTWSIARAQLTKPTITKSSYVYDGIYKEPEFAGLDFNLMNITNFSKTNVGNYTVGVSIKDKTNYEWTDGTQTDLAYNWEITKRKLTKPEFAEFGYNYQYDGTEHRALINNYSEKFMDMEGLEYATNVGDYPLVFSIKNTDNCEWEDESTDDYTITWHINKRKIAYPSLGTLEFYYSGTERCPQLINYTDGTYINITGDYVATNAGNYTVTLKLKDTSVSEWEDGKTDDYSLDWRILKIKNTKPTVSGDSSFSYDGSEKNLKFEGINTDIITITGNTQIDAGNYKTIIELNDKNNYEWDDDSTDDLEFNWSIEKAQLTKPEFADSNPDYEYDGTEHRVFINNYNENYMTMTGSEYATNVGDYPLVFSIKNINNYEWIDGTTKDHTITWHINKKKIDYPTLSKNLFEYTGYEISPQLVGDDLQYLDLSGNYYETNAGNYSLIVSLKDTSLSEWSNGTSDDYTLNWAIAKTKLDKPTLDGPNSFIYDGTNKGLSFTGLTDKITVTGNSHADVGSYTTTIGLADTNNYTWVDGTSSGLLFTWSITKADINPTVYMADYYKNATPSIPVLTGNLGNGEVTYSYAVKGTDNYTNNPPTSVGEYTIKAVIAETSNYNGATVTSNFKVLKYIPETIVLPEGSIVKDVGVYGALIDSYNNEKGTDYDYTHLFTEEELASLQSLSITEEEYHGVSVNDLKDLNLLTSLQNLNINLWENCGVEKLDLHTNTNLKTLTVKNSPINVINISNLSLDSIDLDKPNSIGYLITDRGHDVSYIKNINDNTQYLITDPSTAATATGLLSTNYIINTKENELYEPAYYVVVLGDVRGDGMIDIRDVAKAYSALSTSGDYSAYTNAEKYALDFNNDGKKNGLDLIKIYDSKD